MGQRQGHGADPDFSPNLFEYRGVEQLVARRAHNPEVAGSSPVSATINVLKSQDFRTFSLFSTSKYTALNAGFYA